MNFTGEFWTSLCKLTAYQPHTDGQTERVNQVLETYLWNFVNYDQADWYDLLPLAEFAYHNAEASTTKITRFFTNHGFHLKTTWAVGVETNKPAPKLCAHWMTAITEYAFENLKQTWATMSKYFDKRHLVEPDYKVGNLVMSDTRNIKTKGLTRKFAPKLDSPFPITRVSIRTCTLELGTQWIIFPGFHLSLLELYLSSIRANSPQDRPAG